MREVKIEIQSLLEIPIAYGKAIEVYKSMDGQDQIWNGSIELIRIDFEDNFRRTEYNRVFKITES